MTTWIVKDKKTGKVVFETDKESVVNALNKRNYVAEDKNAPKAKSESKRVNVEDSPAAQ